MFELDSIAIYKLKLLLITLEIIYDEKLLKELLINKSTLNVAF